MDRSYARKSIRHVREIYFEFVGLYFDKNDPKLAWEILKNRLHSRRSIFKNSIYHMIYKRHPGIEHDQSS